MAPPGGTAAGGEDATARFVELVQRPDSSIPLDEVLLVIAAHDHAVDEARARDQLDGLTSGCDADAGAIARHLFVREGFRGNMVHYGDPGNSYLDVVLERRVGIPITLSILMIEVARRRGIALAGVGMPGHFLVGAGDGVYFDPFHDGQQLDVDGARRIFSELRGDVAFRPEFLTPVSPHAIVSRVLANLLNAFVDRDPVAAVWAARLRLRVPGLAPGERREIAALLGSLGRFEEAANELDALAPLLDDDGAQRLARDAAALRARAN